MNHIKYENLSVSTDVLEFRFISDGQHGQIAKIVQYRHIAEDVFNLALGDENENGSIDHECNSNNGDLSKVLATVAFTIYAFTSQYPDNIVFLTGNTPIKTWLYRRAIVNNWEEINKSFNVYGQFQLSNGSYDRELLDRSKEYLGFFIQKKKMLTT